MSMRRWGLVIVTASFAAGYVLFLLSGAYDGKGVGWVWAVSWIPWLLVGALLVMRSAAARVGWVMYTIGLVFMVGLMGDVVYDAVPAATAWLAWVGAWLFVPGFTAITLFLLWFPTGRPLSPRWEVLQIVIVGLAALITGYYALRPGPFFDRPGVENPLGLDVLAPLRDSWIEVAAGGALALCGVLALVSMVMRWIRAEWMERQQLKAVLIPAGLFVVGFLVFGVLVDEGSMSDVGSQVSRLIGVGGMAVGVAVAVTRYRLFEIDRVVSRTVSYTILVGLLAGGYVAGVAVLTRLVPVSSDLAVASSTLAVAALFSPLRRRVQVVVDRRFNRSRYRAGRVVEEFGARLRGGADLDMLPLHLQAVVRDTFEPAAIGVWIREGRR